MCQFYQIQIYHQTSCSNFNSRKGLLWLLSLYSQIRLFTSRESPYEKLLLITAWSAKNAFISVRWNKWTICLQILNMLIILNKLMKVFIWSLNLLTTDFLSTIIFILYSMKISSIIESAGKWGPLTEMKIPKQKVIHINMFDMFLV